MTSCDTCTYITGRDLLRTRMNPSFVVECPFVVFSVFCLIFVRD